MFKRILSVFMSLSILVGVISAINITALAETSGYCGTNIAYILDTDAETLTLKGNGEMWNYSFSNDDVPPWYNSRGLINKVIIPNTITTLGNNAFKDCDSIETFEYTGDVKDWCNISFVNEFSNPNYYAEKFIVNGESVSGEYIVPDNVTSICDNAFSYCTELTSFTISNSTTVIGENILKGSTNINSLTIPFINSSLSAFFGDSVPNSLTKVNITNTSEIPDYAFADCSYITNVTLADMLVTIGKNAFYNCSNIKSIMLPNSLKVIDDYAFSGCNSLKNIIIPDNVSKIGIGAFSNCKNFEQIKLSNNLNEICDSAFENCINLNNITLPNGIEKISNCLFKNCTALSQITLSNSITSIGEYAFDGCVSLINIVLPKNLQLIGDYAFNNCNLENISLENLVTQIGNYTFSGNSNLMSVNIPKNCTSVGNYAFANCNNLTNATIYGNIGEYAFSNCGNLKDVYIGNNVKTIKEYAFNNCKNITNLYIPNTVDIIEAFALYGCNSLRNLSFPYMITNSTPNGKCYPEKVFGYIFGYARERHRGWFPSELYSDYNTETTICQCIYTTTEQDGEVYYVYNYYLPSSLTQVTVLGKDAGAISNGYFRNCGNITDITFDENVTSVGKNVFKECSGLETVKFLNKSCSGDISIPDKTIIYGYSGSAIETFAKDNNYTKFVSLDNCQHIITKESIIEKPTCIDTGVAEIVCTLCNSIIESSVIIPATGHNEVVDVEIKEATCTDNGCTKGSHCSTCGKVLSVSESLNAIGHNIVMASDKQDSTCEENGKEAYYACTNCDYSFGGELIKAKGHSLEVINDEILPKCTSEGRTAISKCKICDKTFGGEIIEKTEHNYKETVIKPTCNSVGYTIYTCTECNDTYNANYIATVAHEYEVNVVQEATCQQQGIKSFVCKNCGYSYNENIDKTSHKWNDGVITINPSCKNSGIKTYTCEYCDFTKEEVLPTIGHTIIIDKATTPTCIKSGMTEGSHCAVCGDIIVEQETIQATSHNYELTSYINPTCTEYGYFVSTCMYCGNEVTALDTDTHPLGHSMTKVVKNATCLIEGEEHYTCERCGYSYSVEIAAKGHTIIIDNAVAPTCTQTGLTEGSHCLICNTVIKPQEVVPAQEHNYRMSIIAPTCVENGYTIYTCNNCGDSYVNNYVNATGHNCVITNVVEPTCTETGLSQGSYCSYCGNIFTKQEIIQSLGHSYDNGKITKFATCTSTGTKTYICLKCKNTKTETIPKLVHTYKSTTNKATINQNGSIIAKCTACGNISENTTIYYPKTIKLSKTIYTYNGKVKKPSVTVKDSNGNVISSNNYTVTYSKGCKNIGKYSVKITFKGNYSGSKILYFTINPKATALTSVKAKSKGFTVKWKKQATQTTGYEIQYATNSKFTKGKKTVTISKNSTTSKTISKLKTKRKYYIRVRTYKLVKVNGKKTKVYSSWSKSKTVTTKS